MKHDLLLRMSGRKVLHSPPSSSIVVARSPKNFAAELADGLPLGEALVLLLEPEIEMFAQIELLLLVHPQAALRSHHQSLGVAHCLVNYQTF